MTTTQKIAPPARKIQSPVTNSVQLGAYWAEAKLLYPIYSAIARKFSLGEPCADLESAAERARPEQVLGARRWLDEMDHLIQVHQFRQFLQSPQYQNPSEQGLRALVLRHLLRPKKAPADGDKIDFLLVQYFALCAPLGVSNQKIDLEDVAEVLKPVLGKVDLRPLDWFDQIDLLLHSLAECRSLRDVMESGILEQGRELKAAAGDMFYYPSALVAFVRFNFLVRRAFIRLMHADLRAIQHTLGKLKSHGVKAVDCHAAGLSAEEPVARLALLCAEWKQPYAGSYTETSVGQSFGKLLAIRAAVEAAVQQRKSQPRPSAAAKASAPVEESSEKKPSKPAAAAPASAAASIPAAPPSTPVKVAPKATAQAPAAPSTKNTHGSAKAPAPSRPAAAPPEAPSAAQAITAETSAHAAPPDAIASVESVDPEACMETIWEQLIEAPPSRGRSMTSVTYQDTKMLLSSWEVSAFVSDGGKISEDLRRGVVARLLVAVAMDAVKRSGKSAKLDPTLLLAYAEAAKLQECVEQAKKAKNTEGAVNLSITAKRLLAYIEEAEALRS